MNNEDDIYKVWEIQAMQARPGADQAQKMLERIAKQVQPIMRKHNWSVKLLSEFWDAYYLGFNYGGGRQCNLIQLALRTSSERDSNFLPYDEVLDTMLHELCHNEHYSHNTNFYKLWDQLRKECAELMANQITGFGFDLPGRRLGGYSTQPPPRKTALSAADKRPWLGYRIGGDSLIMKTLTPGQAAALAAERRLQDDLWCRSQSSYHEAENHIKKKIIVGSSKPSDNSTLALDPTSRKRSWDKDSSLSLYSSSNPKFVDLTMDTPSSSRSLSNNNRRLHSEETAMWQCLTCTLLNKSLAPICELCGTQQPKVVTTKHYTWSCKFCTMGNSAKLERCSACDEWRYSNGPSLGP